MTWNDNLLRVLMNWLLFARRYRYITPPWRQPHRHWYCRRIECSTRKQRKNLEACAFSGSTRKLFCWYTNTLTCCTGLSSLFVLINDAHCTLNNYCKHKQTMTKIRSNFEVFAHVWIMSKCSFPIISSYWSDQTKANTYECHQKRKKKSNWNNL